MTAPTARLTCSDANVCSGAALDGNTIVAVGWGANLSYATYVFVEPAGGWTDMTETAKLTDTDSSTAMAAAVVSGNTVAVIAESNNPPGKVDIFVEPQGGWTNMTPSAQLQATNGDFFQSAAISGSVVLAGAPQYSNSGKGAAYLFVKPTSGWQNMTQSAELSQTDGIQGGEFGTQVAIAGNEIVVTGGNSIQHKAVYLYEEPAGGWTDMTQTAELTEQTYLRSSSSFGDSLAVQGNIVLAGSPTEGTKFDQGYVYAFVEPANGWQNMSQTARFTCATGCSLFGISVALSGGTAVVGAPNSDAVGQALIYGK